MRRNVDKWILGALLGVLLIGGYFAAAPPVRKESIESTTYNPDPKGVKAIYTLLGGHLGYRVARLHKPYAEMPRNTRVLIVVQPPKPMPISLPRTANIPGVARDYSISEDDENALIEWLYAGGVAIFYSDKLAGVPDSLRTSRGLGKGAVYAFSSRRPITNRGMRDYKNAAHIIELIDRHVGKNGVVLFDEYHHGYENAQPLWAYVSKQVWIAIGILVAAGLVLCHTYGRRFGAVRNAPSSETLRPGYEYVQSVARLYRRARATGIVTEHLCGSFRRRVCARFGLPSDATVDTLAKSLPGAVAPRVSRLIARCEAGEKPSEQELLEVAREIRELEEELGFGSIHA